MSSSYLNAPATKLVATHCGYCGRPLLEAESLKAGIGPICRERIGYERQLAPEVRAEVNYLIYAVAAEQHDPELLPQVAGYLARLIQLDFGALVGKLAPRLGMVYVSRTSVDGVVIRTPRIEELDFSALLSAWRKAGVRWDRALKANLVPDDHDVAAWQVLKQFYTGRWLVSDKGATRLGEAP